MWDLSNICQQVIDYFEDYKSNAQKTQLSTIEIAQQLLVRTSDTIRARMIYWIFITLNIIIFITKNKRCCNEIIILIHKLRS